MISQALTTLTSLRPPCTDTEEVGTLFPRESPSSAALQLCIGDLGARWPVRLLGPSTVDGTPLRR